METIEVIIRNRLTKTIKPKAVFGLTATLEMQKEHVRMPVIALTGPVIFEYPLEQSMQDGYTTGGRVLALRFFQTGIAGEAHTTAYARLIVRNKKRNDCIEAVIREAIRRKKTVVVLTERRLHLKILSNRLVGIPHQVLSGAYSQASRISAKDNMNLKRLPLILASRVFYKGIDIRTVDCMIDATGRPGRNAAIQRYGRGVRKAKGKEELLYIDIADAGRDNPFQEASRKRQEAFQEIKIPIHPRLWSGNANELFDKRG